MAGGDKSPAKGNGVEDQFDDLLSLVMARSRGEVGNDAVEKALNSIVTTHIPAASSNKKAKAGGAAPSPDNATQQQQNKDGIIPDDGNYDDDSEDDNISTLRKSTRVTKKAAPKKPPVISASKKPVSAKKKRKSRREREEALESIPLGKMGERMLITFGDGPVPDLEVLKISLLGTRSSLQRVILDARALRRKLKEKWHKARAEATMHRSSMANDETKKAISKTTGSTADIELSFKAMDGCSDNIRRDVPCGFDVEQLEMLFPEEMGAYKRWKKMHEAYTDKNKEVSNKTEEYDETMDEEDDDEEDEETIAPEKEKLKGGRLVERLGNFDARTFEMKGDYYLEFADVRKGSFLPRRGGKNTAGTSDWKEKQAARRGFTAKARASWTRLHPTSVIFLHWLGFDPRSALSPPNEETTQALGFLAYDFFGNIVEKAVSFRLDESESTSKKAKRKPSRSDNPLLELTGGDQLKKVNIDRALVETDLKSLYSSTNLELGNAAKITQLYFGPGFEDRLEMEIDEIFGQKEKTLTQEEMKIRKEEESLFSELPVVPVLLSHVVDVLEDQEEAEVEKDSPKKDDAEKGAATEAEAEKGSANKKLKTSK